jgi:hypothetical protein
MFSRVPQRGSWTVTERKLAAYAVSRKDKSLGETVFTVLSGFFILKFGGVFCEQRLVESLYCRFF